jgi:hypothetical protein
VRCGFFPMLPGFARWQDRPAITRHTAELVAEAKEAIRQSQQTINETRELIRRLDLIIEMGNVTAAYAAYDDYLWRYKECPR